MNRWFAEGKPLLRDFAPYAFYCARVNVLWAVAHTNTGLFMSDENDRKDREYCYYLPFCEIFASKDRKHSRLVPFLLNPQQSFVDSIQLKADLSKISTDWEQMSRQEKIDYREERGTAPPEDDKSIIFNLWKRHRGKIRPSIPLAFAQTKWIDSSLPKDQQVEFTLQDLVKHKEKELMAGLPIPGVDVEKFVDEFGEQKEPSIVVKRTLISKKRLMNLYPHLTEADFVRK